MSSLLAINVECDACAVNRLALCRLKRWNLITICAICALGFGGIGLTVFLYKRQLRLKRSLDELTKKLESLAKQLENDQDTSSSKSLHKSRSMSRRSSYRTCDSDAWITPNQSPSRVMKSVEFVLEPEPEPSPETDIEISQEDFLTDNRSLELLQMQSLEDKNLICEQNRIKYEHDQNILRSTIDFIKSLYVLGESEYDADIKKEHRMKAFEIAKKILDANQTSYLAHKWYAITAGRVVDYVTINEKVRLGFEFKEHLDIAIGLNESDYMLYYLRGRWAFKMCNLSWAERYGVRIVFGKVPDVSIEYAMEDFLKVEELHKNKSKGCSLHLAKCYINQRNIEKALDYLNVAIDLPVRTNEHLVENEEISALLKQYSS